jgi:hypothetical protein
MNLSDLILLNNKLENLTLSDVQADVQNKFAQVMHITDVPQDGVEIDFRSSLYTLNNNLQTKFDSLENELVNYREHVRELITQEGIRWFQASTARYKKDLDSRYAQSPEAVYNFKNTPVVLDPEVAGLIKSRLGLYVDWHYPAMNIHPSTEPWINDMVANDPLYIVDESPYLTESSIAHFNDLYKSRLRIYHIEETFEYPLLQKLPNGQFGFCLVYNYLNYRPFELIKKYLVEIYEKLRPGGVLAMTFNDCDRYQAIQYVEQGISCYTPGTLVKGWAKYIGFEQVFEFQQDGEANTWVEFCKPGKLISLRGGQTLAKIIPKPIAESK